MLIDEVLDRVVSKAAFRFVDDLRIGVGPVAVTLDDGSCGVPNSGTTGRRAYRRTRHLL